MNICKFEGCGKKHHALGFCRAHHINYKRNGDPKPKYDTSRGAKDHPCTIRDPKNRGYLYSNIINDIKYKAVKRGKHWDLDHLQAFGFITAECIYCGFIPAWPESRVGIDRVDNEVGYIFDNCVACCFTCNSAKGDKTLDEFVAWVKRIAERFKDAK